MKTYSETNTPHINGITSRHIARYSQGMLSAPCGPGPILASPKSDSKDGPSLGNARRERYIVRVGEISLRGTEDENSLSSSFRKRSLDSTLQEHVSGVHICSLSAKGRVRNPGNWHTWLCRKSRALRNSIIAPLTDSLSNPPGRKANLKSRRLICAGPKTRVRCFPYGPAIRKESNSLQILPRPWCKVSSMRPAIMMVDGKFTVN